MCTHYRLAPLPGWLFNDSQAHRALADSFIKHTTDWLSNQTHRSPADFLIGSLNFGSQLCCCCFANTVSGDDASKHMTYVLGGDPNDPTCPSPGERQLYSHDTAVLVIIALIKCYHDTAVLIAIIK
jgi:hypothetical protein